MLPLVQLELCLLTSPLDDQGGPRLPTKLRRYTRLDDRERYFSLG